MSLITFIYRKYDVFFRTYKLHSTSDRYLQEYPRGNMMNLLVGITTIFVAIIMIHRIYSTNAITQIYEFPLWTLLEFITVLCVCSIASRNVLMQIARVPPIAASRRDAKLDRDYSACPFSLWSFNFWNWKFSLVFRKYKISILGLWLIIVLLEDLCAEYYKMYVSRIHHKFREHDPSNIMVTCLYVDSCT